MYRFTRTATARNAAVVPAGIQFATEVTAYLNKKYDLKLRFGIELFGGSTIHWQFETDSLDKITALNAKLLQDPEYIAILQKEKEVWADGSLRDCIVFFPG